MLMMVGSNWLRGSPVNYNWKGADVSMEKGEVLWRVLPKRSGMRPFELLTLNSKWWMSSQINKRQSNHFSGRNGCRAHYPHYLTTIMQ